MLFHPIDGNVAVPVLPVWILAVNRRETRQDHFHFFYLYRAESDMIILPIY